MLDVYRAALPHRDLLIVRGYADPGSGEEVLAHALYQVSLSGTAAVWVDCSLVESLSGEAAHLLVAYAHQLPLVGSSLVLCHVGEALRQALTTYGAGGVAVAPSLLDAN